MFFALLLLAWVTAPSIGFVMPPNSGGGGCSCPAAPACPPPPICAPPPPCPPPPPCVARADKTLVKDRPDELEMRAKVLGGVNLDEQLSVLIPPHKLIESIVDRQQHQLQEESEEKEPGPWPPGGPKSNEKRDGEVQGLQMADDDSDLIAGEEKLIRQKRLKREGQWLVRHKRLKREGDTKAARKADAADHSKPEAETEVDLKCNSSELKALMLQNIAETTSISKRAINDKAEEVFGGSIDVICSKGHFSYVYSSNLYCEASKNEITCIAFRQAQ